MTAVFSLVVVSGALATVLITPKYEATMRVFISRNCVDPQISAGEKTADVTSGDISDEEFNSELELIKNGEVIEGAVRSLDLQNDQMPSGDHRFAFVRQRVKLKFDELIARQRRNVKKILFRSTRNLFCQPKPLQRKPPSPPLPSRGFVLCSPRSPRRGNRSGRRGFDVANHRGGRGGGNVGQRNRLFYSATAVFNFRQVCFRFIVFSKARSTFSKSTKSKTRRV